ncbi:hypothetical protein LINPERPRIM_LOCUS14878 [Linum perenne]
MLLGVFSKTHPCCRQVQRRQRLSFLRHLATTSSFEDFVPQLENLFQESCND